MSETDPNCWFTVHPWQVREARFDPARYRFGEGVLALANGYLGQRASFEEGAPAGAATLPGTYIAGVFDAAPSPQMIRLKGRPSEPRQMVNVPSFLPVDLRLDGERLALSAANLESYSRVLHLDRGLLVREVLCRTASGRRVRVEFSRFFSRLRRHIAASRVTVTPLDGPCAVDLAARIDGAVTNAGDRHHLIDHETLPDGLRCRTRVTGIAIAMVATPPMARQSLRAGETLVFDRLVAVATSRDVDVTGDPAAAARAWLGEAVQAGFEALLAEQEVAWAELWRGLELEIEERSGAGALTQGLRYCIFQMIQNAPNQDATVNIGAKGLTGEHYYGTYFWDTEIFMLPMLALVQPALARDLLRSRFHLLPGARAKAAELGFRGAMFPWMSDADGNEACALWQFGLLDVHPSADVAWAIWFYYCVTGDWETIAAGGLETLVETSRFWVSRVHYRPDRRAYVINRVLGPDEYHQAVDNNYYTNIMAQENLRKTVLLLAEAERRQPGARARLGVTDEELRQFTAVADQLHLPYDAAHECHLQDDTFNDLEPYDLQRHPPGGALPAVWSYDRILRTQLLRQGDVIVANLLLGDRFTTDEVRRDFDRYEPITTHDSSLSFCHHSILAAQLRRGALAYDYFLRTARLDLDDLHGNAWMGVHAASLAGAWQCVALGFGGLRWFDGQLRLDPCLPAAWAGYRFSSWWRGRRVTVAVRPGAVELAVDGPPLEVRLGNRTVQVTNQPTAHACRTTFDD